MMPLHFVIPVYLAMCLVLGGASSAGYMSNMLLQLAAIPILFASLFVTRQTPIAPAGRSLMMLVALLVCLVLAQLIPLPPVVWTALPGRVDVAQGFAMLGQPLPWLPLSLTPDRTFYALLWWLPAIAALLGIVRLGAFRPAWIAWTIVGVTVLSVGIGALQVASGTQAAVYFYDITNRGFAVGFFANNNHMATLLLVSLPFLAVLAAGAFSKSRRGRGKSSGMIVLCATILLIVLVGLAINSSLAGLGLSIPVAAASIQLVRSRRVSVPKWAVPLVGALAIAGVATVFMLPIGDQLTSADAGRSVGTRQTFFARTIDASIDYLPVGSGLGSFVQVYRGREDPAEATNEFVNHAHGDLIEVGLETGIPGLLLVILLLIWWGRRTVAIWQAAEPDLFARAATIASAAILVHSLVDYPLRTAAIAAVFAVCLALMSEPRPKVRRGRPDESSARHFSVD